MKTIEKMCSKCYV